MKHKNLSTLTTLYNIVKVGGNVRYKDVDTSSNRYQDERKDFVDLVRSHGYDVLTSSDWQFVEKVSEYNRVIERRAKYEDCTSYDKCSFGAICVCGDWLFTEQAFDYDTETVDIIDNRGGKREGSGRKAKHAVLGGTASIRVPAWQKDECRQLIDYLIDMQSKESPLYTALSRIIMDAESHIEDMEQSGLDMTEHRKNIEVLEELKNRIPIFSFVKENETKSK